jgi:DNA polymerase-3 subunit chi
MTRVDFYFNAAGKADVAMRLAAKAYQAGQRTLLYTEDEALAAELDAGLWTAQQISFIPHVRCGHPLAARTPVLIGVQPDELASCDVLINLTPEPPDCFARFDRLIEIVTADETDRLRARSRFRFYQERGYALQTHDLGRKT